MTHGKVRYSDFAVIDAILVCLNLSKKLPHGHLLLFYLLLISCNWTCPTCVAVKLEEEYKIARSRFCEGALVAL